MAPTKRKSTAPVRAAKKTRYTKLIPTVVDAIAGAAEVLPSNVRTLLKSSLPVVLNINKADRHAYEAEVVDQAQRALADLQAAIEQKHATAASKQNDLVAPAEEARRQQAKTDAEAHMEAAKAKLEASKATKKAAEKSVDDAETVVKSAQKEEKALDKELQRCADKKDHLSTALTHEFVVLKDGTGVAALAKKALQKLVAIGKEFGLDNTLLNVLPIAYKKQVDSRTEFESKVFTSLQALLEREIGTFLQKVVEAEQDKVAKAAAVAGASDTLESAKATLTSASEDLVAAQAALKDAAKATALTETNVRNIYKDMKAACDEQDRLANDLKKLKEDVWAAFNQLKDKEPEPEHGAEAAAETAVQA